MQNLEKQQNFFLWKLLFLKEKYERANRFLYSTHFNMKLKGNTAFVSQIISTTEFNGILKNSEQLLVIN